MLKVHIAVILFLDALSFCLSFCYAVTLSDCYVTLWLPTASTEKVRTRTIRNSKNPVWNEAFCYKIDRRVKVMKINVFQKFFTIHYLQIVNRWCKTTVTSSLVFCSSYLLLNHSVFRNSKKQLNFLFWNWRGKRNPSLEIFLPYGALWKMM